MIHEAQVFARPGNKYARFEGQVVKLENSRPELAPVFLQGPHYSNIYVTIPPLTGIRVAEYLDPSGRAPFRLGEKVSGTFLIAERNGS